MSSSIQDLRNLRVILPPSDEIDLTGICINTIDIPSTSSEGAQQHSQELFFDILRAQSEGCDVMAENDGEYFSLALETFTNTYLYTDDSCLNALRVSFKAHFESSCTSENHLGRAAYCLNLFILLQNIEDPKVIQAFSKCAAEAWKSCNNKYLNAFASSIEKAPENAKHYIHVAKGILLLEWMNEHPSVSNYEFCFTNGGNKESFTLKDSQGAHRIFTDTSPEMLIGCFLNSWRTLEQENPDNPNLFNELAGDLGFTDLNLTAATRPSVVKMMLDKFESIPLLGNCSQLFSIPAIRYFKKIIDLELARMKKEGLEVISSAYVNNKLYLYELRHSLQSVNYNTPTGITATLIAIQKYLTTPNLPIDDLLKCLRLVDKNLFQNSPAICVPLYTLMTRGLELVCLKWNVSKESQHLSCFKEMIEIMQAIFPKDDQTKKVNALILRLEIHGQILLQQIPFKNAEADRLLEFIQQLLQISSTIINENFSSRSNQLGWHLLCKLADKFPAYTQKLLDRCIFQLPPKLLCEYFIQNPDFITIHRMIKIIDVYSAAPTSIVQLGISDKTKSTEPLNSFIKLIHVAMHEIFSEKQDFSNIIAFLQAQDRLIQKHGFNIAAVVLNSLFCVVKNLDINHKNYHSGPHPLDMTPLINLYVVCLKYLVQYDKKLPGLNLLKYTLELNMKLKKFLNPADWKKISERITKKILKPILTNLENLNPAVPLETQSIFVSLFCYLPFIEHFPDKTIGKTIVQKLFSRLEKDDHDHSIQLAMILNNAMSSVFFNSNSELVKLANVLIRKQCHSISFDSSAFLTNFEFIINNTDFTDDTAVINLYSTYVSVSIRCNIMAILTNSTDIILEFHKLFKMTILKVFGDSSPGQITKAKVYISELLRQIFFKTFFIHTLISVFDNHRPLLDNENLEKTIEEYYINYISRALKILAKNRNSTPPALEEIRSLYWDDYSKNIFRLLLSIFTKNPPNDTLNKCLKFNFQTIYQLKFRCLNDLLNEESLWCTDKKASVFAYSLKLTNQSMSVILPPGIPSELNALHKSMEGFCNAMTTHALSISQEQKDQFENIYNSHPN